MDGAPQQMRRLAVLFSLLGWGDEGPPRAGFLCAPPFEATLAPGPVTLLEAALTLPLAPFGIADDRALQLTMPPHDDAIPPGFTRASRRRGGSVSPRTHAGGGVLCGCAQRSRQEAQRRTNSQECAERSLWHRHGCAPL